MITKNTVIKQCKTLQIAHVKEDLISTELVNQYRIEKSKNYSKIEINYGSLHKVTRIWNKKEKNKSCYPSHYNHETKQWENSVGDEKDWFPYQTYFFSEADEKWIVIHEGEKATDFALNRGIISTCVLGAKAQSEIILQNAIDYFRTTYIFGAIYIADNDDAGQKKAKAFQQIAFKNKFPLLILPIDFIYPEAKKGDDFVEYLEANQNKSSAEIAQDIQNKVIKFINPLVADYLSCDQKKIIIGKNEAIESAKQILMENHGEIESFLLLDEIRKKAGFSDYQWNNKIIKPLNRELKQDRLQLEINVYVNEPDLFKRLQLKAKICTVYSLSSKDFGLLVKHTETQQSKPEKTVFNFSDFMKLESSQENWLIPSFLPVGEMLLLTALPKVGKTLLANDVAYAVLCGGEILGEKATQGKVLYISSDETAGSLSRRFQSRGFDLLPQAGENLRVMTELQLSDLSELELQLEDFRPDLIIIDSLTSITNDLGISEKDSEFARQIYKLKDLLKKYNASSILIHHENKSTEAKGILKVAGSARITAAVWGIAQLEGGDTTIEDSQTFNAVNLRWLNIQPREGQKIKYELEINPKDCWAEMAIFKFNGDYDDKTGEKKKQAEEVLSLLADGKRLEYSELNDQLHFGRSLYMVLDRLVERQLISRARSTTNQRRWVYFIDSQCQEDQNQKSPKKATTPPPLTYLPTSVDSTSETIANHTLEFSQRLSQQTNVLLTSEKTDNPNNNEILTDFSTSQQNKGEGGSRDNNFTLTSPNSNCEQPSFNDNEDLRRTLLELIFNLQDKYDNFDQIINEYLGDNKSLSSLTDAQLNFLYETLKI